MDGAELRRHLEAHVLPRMPAGTRLVRRALIVPPVDWLKRSIGFGFSVYGDVLPDVTAAIFPLWEGRTWSHSSYSLELSRGAMPGTTADEYFEAIADAIVERGLPWLDRYGDLESFARLVGERIHPDYPEQPEALVLAGRHEEALKVAHRALRTRGPRLDRSRPHELDQLTRYERLVEELEAGAHERTRLRLRAARDRSAVALGLEPPPTGQKRPRSFSKRELRALVDGHVMPALPEWRFFVRYGFEIRPRRGEKKAWVARQITLDWANDDERGFHVVAVAQPRFRPPRTFTETPLGWLHVGGPGHVWHVDPGQEANIGAELRDAVIDQAVPFLDRMADPGELGRFAVADGAPDREANARELTAYALFLGGDQTGALAMLADAPALGRIGRLGRMRTLIERDPHAARRQLEAWRDG